jgi:hypothetical protein
MRASRLYPIMLSVSELAAAMRVDRRVVYSMIGNGLPLYKIGVKKRLLVRDVLDFIPLHFKRDGSQK